MAEIFFKTSISPRSVMTPCISCRQTTSFVTPSILGSIFPIQVLLQMFSGKLIGQKYCKIKITHLIEIASKTDVCLLIHSAHLMIGMAGPFISVRHTTRYHKKICHQSESRKLSKNFLSGRVVSYRYK